MMSEKDWEDFYGIPPNETHELRQKRLRIRQSRFERDERVSNGTADQGDKWSKFQDEFGY